MGGGGEGDNRGRAGEEGKVRWRMGWVRIEGESYHPMYLYIPTLVIGILVCFLGT